MHFLYPITLLLTLTIASPVHDFENLNSTNSSTADLDLLTRGISSMKGTCVINDKTKANACKVTMKKYDCRNSNCNGKKGATCVVAHGETKLEAKCPNNELSYEWDWPWKGN